MVTIKNILVATDFSAPSQVALEYGRQLARAFGARLHVLHVVGNVATDAIGIEGFTTDFATLQHEIEASARKQLEALVTEDDRRTLAVQTSTITSSAPAASITSYCKEAGIDLAVVGTHGRGGVTHLLVGSVAERVMRTAPCPVLTVRSPLAQEAPQDARQAMAHA